MPRIALTPHADRIAVVAFTLLLAALPGRAHAEDTGSRVVGSGVAKTESRNVSDFHAIALGLDARVELRQGDSEGMSITGDDNIVPLVEAIVEKGILKIRWLGNRNYSPRYKALDIVVNAKSVDAIGSAAPAGSTRTASRRGNCARASAGPGGSPSTRSTPIRPVPTSTAAATSRPAGGSMRSTSASPGRGTCPRRSSNPGRRGSPWPGRETPPSGSRKR